MPEINGIAHIQLTVSDMALSRPFYSTLLSFMGMQAIIDDPTYLYYIGARTGVAISPVTEGNEGSSYRQGAVGLHHVCFRARNREAVDEMHQIAADLGATVVRRPQEDGYAPGYYSTLFEDPDGIRIEVNFVPGKGHLKEP